MKTINKLAVKILIKTTRTSMSHELKKKELKKLWIAILNHKKVLNYSTKTYCNIQNTLVINLLLIYQLMSYLLLTN